MESTPGNTHSVTFFPPGNVFFGSMISTMHPLTTNTAAVLRQAAKLRNGTGSPELAHAAEPHQTQWARASNARAHPVTESCVTGGYRLAANFLRAAAPAAIMLAMPAKA